MYVPFLHGHLEYLGRVYSAGSIQAMGCACSYMCVCVCVCVCACAKEQVGSFMFKIALLRNVCGKSIQV